jgi:hypothetical protein
MLRKKKAAMQAYHSCCGFQISASFEYVSLINLFVQIKSRRMRWAGHVARMGEGGNVYRVLVRKPEGKRPFERPRRRWKDGIKMNLREIGWGGGGDMDSPGSE